MPDILFYYGHQAIYEEYPEYEEEEEEELYYEPPIILYQCTIHDCISFTGQELWLDSCCSFEVSDDEIDFDVEIDFDD